MDTNELDRLEALEKAATPDWYVYKDEDGRAIAVARLFRGRGKDVAHRPTWMDLDEWDETAAFIAALRNAAPSLIADARALAAANARVAELEREVEDHQQALLACREVLSPIADCVFNDNHDLTISAPMMLDGEAIGQCYWAHRRAARLLNP